MNPRYKLLVCTHSAAISIHDTQHPNYDATNSDCHHVGASYPWAIAHYRGAYSKSFQGHYTPDTSMKKAHALCTILNGGTY